MIRQAKLSEIPDILKVTKACTAKMIAAGIYQWNDHYPSKEVFEKDIERQELFVLEYFGKIIGGVVITTLMDDVYRTVAWLTQTDKNVYIHRLFVHPDFQAQGYAQKLMSFAEEQSRTKGFVSVRLDTFSQNKRNQRFYEARGYQRLEHIFLPKQSEYPFPCYELVL